MVPADVQVLPGWRVMKYVYCVLMLVYIINDQHYYPHENNLIGSEKPDNPAYIHNIAQSSLKQPLRSSYEIL